MTRSLWRGAGCAAMACVVVSASSCISGPETAVAQLSEARRLSSDLLVQFTTVADAGNRAVMADTDEASAAFAREAEEATQAVETSRAALAPILTALRYTAEAGLLEEFGTRFAEYRKLDQDILSLAVENTNLKAQRLSFGAARDAADAFGAALDGVTGSAPANDSWHARALAATAVAAVREIQVQQSPHIAEAGDAAMTRMEQQMATAETDARHALEELTRLVPSNARPQVTAASAALDRFMHVNAEIIVLSRRNTNVRSLALSLGQKRMLTAACDETLHALQDALAKRSFAGTR